MSNKNKTEFLGMNASTASHRLKKLIMFSLIQEVKKNICLKCGREIETAEELSVDHIRPWLYVDKNMFWDLNNIGFSHKKCNKIDRPYLNRRANRKNGRAGTAWCRTHKKFLPKKNFFKRVKRWNGVEDECMECKRARNHGHDKRDGVGKYAITRQEV